MIGIFGGTFDPVHFGHLRPALDCLQGLGLEQVRFIPLNVAVHRPQPLASPRLRRAMLEAATGPEPGFVVDTRELARAGGSYTHDTLCSLRSDFGTERSLCLLIGADAYAGFLDWYRPLDILALAHLVVMHRPDHHPAPDARLRTLYHKHGSDHVAELKSAPGGRILFQNVTQIAVSATQVRKLVAHGASPRYLLPEAVLDVIEREALYR